MAKITLNNVKDAVNICKEVLPLINPVIKKHGPELVDQVAKKAILAGNAVEEATKSGLGKIQQYKDSKEQKKALAEARKRAVSISLPAIPADEFFRNFEANISDENDLSNGYMAITGCYAILVFKSQHEKDLSEYEEVYIGFSKSMGLDVYSQFRGLGNVDVYADFKFKKPIKVLLYPCTENELPTRYNELLESFQPYDSYNKWDLLSSDDNQ